MHEIPVRKEDEEVGYVGNVEVSLRADETVIVVSKDDITFIAAAILQSAAWQTERINFERELSCDEEMMLRGLRKANNILLIEIAATSIGSDTDARDLQRVARDIITARAAETNPRD